MSKDRITTVLGILAAIGLGVSTDTGVVPPGTVPQGVQEIGGLVSVISVALWGYFTNRGKPTVTK